MAKYRYFLGDLLTNTIAQELPMYGVWFTRRLNKPGNATFSFNLGDSSFPSRDIIADSIPGRSVFWVERNNELIWGGPIWSRTYQAQAKALSFTAQTFESFLHKQYIEATLTYTTTDQRNIIRNLITVMQAKPSANIGILVPSAFANDVVRTETFPDYDSWSFGKAIEYMVNYADGFDYTIEVGYDSNGLPSKWLRTDNQLGQSVLNTHAVFDYPGNIKNYYYPESASEGVVSMLGFGAGETVTMLQSKFTFTALLDQGWPDLQNAFTNRDVSVQGTLDSKTEAAANTSRAPITVPTFEINSEMTPQFGSYALGDGIRVHIEDERFPEGKDILSRIIGWDMKPSSSESQEDLKFVVAGEEA